MASTTTQFIPGATIPGRVEGVFAALGAGFETAPLDAMELTYEGIPGDLHGGLIRKSTSREPWYGRDVEMKNDRQVSLLSVEDLAAVAAKLKLDRLPAEWIGGNILVSGIPDFSLLPARTLLMFQGGASVRIGADNGPCRSAGRSIARHVPGRPKLEFEFVEAAYHQRGLVGWVERPGTLRAGSWIKARIFEQWIYRVE